MLLEIYIYTLVYNMSLLQVNILEHKKSKTLKNRIRHQTTSDMYLIEKGQQVKKIVMLVM